MLQINLQLYSHETHSSCFYKAQTQTKAIAVGMNSDDHKTSEHDETGSSGGIDRFHFWVRPHHNDPTSTRRSRGGKELHYCFYKLHMQQSQHSYREGDKLKTDRGSEAYNKTKRLNDGCLWSQGLRLSLPVICWV